MKKVLFTILMILGVSMLFSQSYDSYLSKAKEYEGKKQWCLALDAYYDAMAADISVELKEEAYKGYEKLKDTIESGNPGYGSYNATTLRDAWKALLIESEQYACTYNTFKVNVGELKQVKVNNSAKTATYSADITYVRSDRYNRTVGVIAKGYAAARKSSWTLPANWPEESASSAKNSVYSVNGAYIYKENSKYYNAFALAKLMDVKFNVVDKNGKELFAGKRCLIGAESTITLEGISFDVMNKIEKGEAFLNPVVCYLQYGEYNKADDKGGRTFIKKFPEFKLPETGSTNDKAVFIYWKNRKDVKAEKVNDWFRTKQTQAQALKNAEWIKSVKWIIPEVEEGFNFVPGKEYLIQRTEVTQSLYELITGINPSYSKGEKNPVDNVSWYDAIYFCNKLSLAAGLDSVYAVDGNTDIAEWGYTPHKFESINGTITQDTGANGYRLPTEEEWEYAAKGGMDDNRFSGSNSISEVAWWNDAGETTSHPVGQLNPNDYGLYDMTGNVCEWCWETDGNGNSYHRGSGYRTPISWEGGEAAYKPYELTVREKEDSGMPNIMVGFRIVRNGTAEELKAAAEKYRADKEKAAKDSGNELKELLKDSFAVVPGKDIVMGKTHVSQRLYELIMGQNPVVIQYGQNDVINPEYRVHDFGWYDAIYFCNALSVAAGLNPVYAVNGNTDIAKWGYIPHKHESINGNITQNTKADGFRLPTDEELTYVEKDAEDYTFLGLFEAEKNAWLANFYTNWTWYFKEFYPVGQMKNRYGFYDIKLYDLLETIWDDRYPGGALRLVRKATTEELRDYTAGLNGASSVDIQYAVNELFAPVPGKNYAISKTEINQKLYEKIMGENPSHSKNESDPVESVSWYDAIYFCNRFSVEAGFEPVYAVNGNTDVKKWGYTPHKGGSIRGTITQNTKADGFRLPTEEEWEYAARGGQNFTYSGGNNLDKVAWHFGNTDYLTIHKPVAKLQANGYGLYDMSGNVAEWCWDADSNGNRTYRGGGGGMYAYSDFCKVTSSESDPASTARFQIGIRLVRAIK